MNRIAELRVYKLKPGAAAAFEQRFRDAIGPMLARHGIELVHFGPSLADPDSFCLIRAYPSVEKRQAALDAFYGGQEWLEQHDEAVMAMIDSYNTCVIEAGALGLGINRLAKPRRSPIPGRDVPSATSPTS